MAARAEAELVARYFGRMMSNVSKPAASSVGEAMSPTYGTSGAAALMHAASFSTKSGPESYSEALRMFGLRMNAGMADTFTHQ